MYSSSYSLQRVLAQDGVCLRLRLLKDKYTLYFVDNQLPTHGLALDRQRNFEPQEFNGWVSLSATGMGLILLALTCREVNCMITKFDARRRIKLALETGLQLKNDHGILPHFVTADTLSPVSSDQAATIDCSWFMAGGLAAAYYLEDDRLIALAEELYDRVDWRYWSTKRMSSDAVMLVHGADPAGTWLPGKWDRLNGETAFMYLMAIGARDGKFIPPVSWQKLPTAPGAVEGLTFASADLGLFVANYSSTLVDFGRVQSLGQPNLGLEAVKAAEANYRVCRRISANFSTYRQFWGLSAGDVPGTNGDEYHAVAPGHEVDGTAFITATFGSIEHVPDLVLRNLKATENGGEPRLWEGKYGFSNVNLDRNWVSRDIVGIDVGIAGMAIANALHNGLVREIWHKVPAMRRALSRLELEALR